MSKPSPLRTILERYGAAFESGLPNSQFYLPRETRDSIPIMNELTREIAKITSTVIRFVRMEGVTWAVYRYCGERRNDFKIIRVRDRSAPAGVNEDLVIEIHRNGVINIREKARRVGYETTVASIYVGCLLREVNKKQLAKARDRKAVKAARRKK